MAKKIPKVDKPIIPTAVKKTEPVKKTTDIIFENNLTNNKYSKWILLAMLFVCGFYIFYDFITLKNIYLFTDIGSDSLNIFYPWMVQSADAIKHGLCTWTFKQGLGQNMYPQSISDLLCGFLTFFSKDTYTYGLAFAEFFKVILAGIIFYKYLSLMQLSKYASIVGAFLFAFSGYIILGGCWTIFSYEAVIAAIILYGLENWMQHKKWLWFFIGLFLMALVQPFFLYMYCILIAVYGSVRYYVINDGFKNAIPFILKTAGISIVAILLSGFQLFPVILQYIESPRVSGDAGHIDKLRSAAMFAFSSHPLIYSDIIRSFSSDVLGTGIDYKGWNNYLEDPLFYCGVLSLVAFIHSFTFYNKKQKIAYGILLSIFIIPLIFPYLRYVFWAFTGDYFRTFSLFIAILLLFFTANSLDLIIKNKTINKIVLAVSSFLVLGIFKFALSRIITPINTDLSNLIFGLILIYSFLIYGLSLNGKIQFYAMVALLVVIFLEAAYFSNITINNRAILSAEDYKAKKGYNDYSNDAVNFLHNTDKGFYRINKDYSSTPAMHGSLNDSKVQNYFGTSSYYSFNQKYYVKFLGDMGVINPKDEYDTRWINGLLSRPFLFSLAAGKYCFCKHSDGFLKNIGYDSVAKFSDITVYKNNYALPLGFCYTKFADAQQLKTLNNFQKDITVLNACVIDSAGKDAITNLTHYTDVLDTLQPFTLLQYNSYIQTLKTDSLQITNFKEDEITGNVNCKNNELLFLSIPYDEGWQINVNDKPVKYYRVNAGFIGVKLNAGNNKIHLKFVPRYLKQGLIVSIISLIVFILLLLLPKFLAKKNND